MSSRCFARSDKGVIDCKKGIMRTGFPWDFQSKMYIAVEEK